ncbi:uroporphyrinogen decarboxylase [Mycena rosella]|uniref:Uroporphyrinogen decarboxylase n=1 Tax=Mycena rosella TaxID=1033263 RepID=A0AAD7DC62_MYCRO|nr:uroporphyrinogen decarboxylase [Mycena rosella]
MAQDFPPLKNDLLLRAARGEKTEHAPAWIMRQAGRYLPEFREISKTHGFFEMCRTPELATELTLQPIRRFSGLIDAAIIFSDILVVPQAMGMEILMNPGPFFPAPLETPADVSKLRAVDVNKELGYVFAAITQTRVALAGEVPLIGFCGAPWTLFVYMIEGGGGSKTFQKVKTWIFKYPAESTALLARIADVCVDYLVGQAKAGAQLLQVFDSAAGELSPHDFALFSLPTLVHISRTVRARLAAAGLPQPPMTLFAKGAAHALPALAGAGYDTLGLDWKVDPAEARRAVGGTVALQGNMDPHVLYGGRAAIERTVQRMCAGFAGEGGWIANLGHGITPAVDPEDVRWFFECVRKYSARKTATPNDRLSLPKSNV